MPAPTPGYVKNMIRRCLREQVDRSPNTKQIDELWNYFGSCCAYCGKSLQRGRKEGHVDHLVSASKGGGNGIENRVLSCASCNEMEKLDEDWRSYLYRKVTDPAERLERLRRIEHWVLDKSKGRTALEQEVLREIESLAEKVVGEFDLAIQAARSIAGRLKIQEQPSRPRNTRDGRFPNATRDNNPYTPGTAHWAVYEKLRSDNGVSFEEIIGLSPRSTSKTNASTYISNVRRDIRSSRFHVVRIGERFRLEAL